MKVTIEQDEKIQETDVVIRCNTIDKNINNLAQYINNYNISFNCKKDGNQFIIFSNDIYYFETIDDKTFVYCEKQVYEINNKLYELEQILTDTYFIRVNKSTILNINYILSFKSCINGKIEATLMNEEKIFINRHYVQILKDKLDER